MKRTGYISRRLVALLTAFVLVLIGFYGGLIKNKSN